MRDSLTEKKRFLALLVGMSDYYGKPLSAAAQELYWKGLMQFDYEAIEQAMWRHTQMPDEAGRWMPTISDICKMIGGASIDKAAVAWTKVDGAVRRIGTYVDVVFDDPLIHRIIADMGGWIWFGSRHEKDWPFIEKEFQTRYRGLAMRGEVPPYAPVLTGISNAQNGEQGYGTADTRIYIGDPRAAALVLAGGTNGPLIGMTRVNAVQLLGVDHGR